MARFFTWRQKTGQKRSASLRCETLGSRNLLTAVGFEGAADSSELTPELMSETSTDGAYVASATESQDGGGSNGGNDGVDIILFDIVGNNDDEARDGGGNIGGNDGADILLWDIVGNNDAEGRDGGGTLDSGGGILNDGGHMLDDGGGGILNDGGRVDLMSTVADNDSGSADGGDAEARSTDSPQQGQRDIGGYVPTS